MKKAKAFFFDLGSLLVAPLVIFLMVPNELIKKNVLEFSYPSTGVIAFLTLFISSYAFLVLSYLFLPAKRKLIFVASTTLGLNVFAWSALSGAYESCPILVVALFETLFFIIVAWSLRRMVFDTMSQVLFAISCVQLVWIGVDHFQTWSHWVQHSSSAKIHSGSKNLVEAKGNVYHIILDTFQGEAYQWMRENQPDAITGIESSFLYFPKFVTNEGRTQFSNAIMVYGKLYEPGNLSPSDWQNQAYQNGYWADIVDANVNFYQYPYHPYYCNKKAQLCHHTSQLIQKTDSLLGGSSRIFIDLTFLNVIPRSLNRFLNRDVGKRNFDWSYGFSITAALAPMYLSSSNAAHLPLFSKQLFERLIEDESERSSSGNYIFSHLILPHEPYVFDENCNYLGHDHESEWSDWRQFMPQAVCSLKLIDKLISKLKELNRFDDSLIIVHSDHGMSFHPKDLGEMLKYTNIQNTSMPAIDFESQDSAKLPPEMVQTRTSGLLLIKFPRQNVRASADGIAQTIDIAPTILKYFGLNFEKYDGHPLDEISKKERPIYTLITMKVPDSENPFKFSRYVLDSNSRWKFDRDIYTGVKVTD